MPPLTRSSFTPLKRLKESDHGGQNSGIYLVRNAHTHRTAIEKRLPRSAVARGLAAREARAMQQCAHPNIIRLLFFDPDCKRTGYASLFLPRCELGSLDRLTANFATRRCEIPEGWLWKVLWDVALALCYLQRGVDARESAQLGRPIGRAEKAAGWNGIAHRDVKPANIFLTWNGGHADARYPTAVLADFGGCISLSDMAAKPPQEAKELSLWTRAFEPPEAPRFSDASDAYSLALGVHCMALLREVPCEDKVLLRERPVGAGGRYSGFLEGVLRRCLREGWRERPDAAYLPYLVWREMERAAGWAKGRGERGAAAFARLPEWAFE
ncbi:kinase-like protein [Trematosphaeria pertusa]|uniref:non-specific serine/threonine protein kinase n=1 Tax=Trematosphaeria pertusa TaxID=390896 RepID=A0A6A6I7C4_9PLEO|nr:kinase-like protein [Trematosphaeria pertusa]KAF2246246.1 kinase-like protein [Trematosphaeria pertusa]